jgi:hypothetical protein
MFEYVISNLSEERDEKLEENIAGILVEQPSWHSFFGEWSSNVLVLGEIVECWDFGSNELSG